MQPHSSAPTENVNEHKVSKRSEWDVQRCQSTRVVRWWCACFECASWRCPRAERLWLWWAPNTYSPSGARRNRPASALWGKTAVRRKSNNERGESKLTVFENGLLELGVGNQLSHIHHSCTAHSRHCALSTKVKKQFLSKFTNE